MGTLTEEELKNLPTRYKTIPYSTFFKVWYALQKSLPADKKDEILTKMGRTIGREFNDEGIETIEDFLYKLREFLEEDWAITDKAKVKFQRNSKGDVIKLEALQDSCKMCFANTYYRFHDNGNPSCIFPQVIMGILSKVRKKFGFKNLRFEGVQKGGVGVCTMTWNLK